MNLSNPESIKKPQLNNIIDKTMTRIAIDHLKNNNKKGDFAFYIFLEIKYRIQSATLNPAKSRRKSSKSSDSKNVLNF